MLESAFQAAVESGVESHSFIRMDDASLMLPYAFQVLSELWCTAAV